jgi:hypothetical protein
MSYTYLAEQGEVCSAQSFSDIESSVLSRLKNTQDKCCSNGNEMACSHGSQSGTTSVPSMESRGEESLTPFAEVFPAKMCQLLERVRDLMENEAASGARCSGWFAKYDPDLSLWKTPQCSLLEDYIEFSETWPQWGMMQSGVCSEQTMPELGIGGKESGSLRNWPTPVRNDYLNSGYQLSKGKPHDTLPGATGSAPNKPKNWPTPTAHDRLGAYSEDAITRNDGKSRLDMLATLVVHQDRHSFPTPGTKGLSNGSGNCEKANKLHEQGILTEQENGGQLNPDWVEWLMGWPIGWTRLEPITLDWRDWETDPADNGEIPRTTHEKTNRANRLKAIGNGQVPLVAALAFTILSKETI